MIKLVPGEQTLKSLSMKSPKTPWLTNWRYLQIPIYQVYFFNSADSWISFSTGDQIFRSPNDVMHLLSVPRCGARLPLRPLCGHPWTSLWHWKWNTHEGRLSFSFFKALLHTPYYSNFLSYQAWQLCTDTNGHSISRTRTAVRQRSVENLFEKTPTRNGKHLWHSPY